MYSKRNAFSELRDINISFLTKFWYVPGWNHAYHDTILRMSSRQYYPPNNLDSRSGNQCLTMQNWRQISCTNHDGVKTEEQTHFFYLSKINTDVRARKCYLRQDAGS